MFRSVLVGLDSSPFAELALAEAVDLASRHGGRLTILSVVPEVRSSALPPVESMTTSDQVTAQLEKEAAAVQRRALERVPQCVPTVTIVRRGTRRAEFLRELRRAEHDVLVIGAEPRTSSGLRFTRSFTRYLIDRSPVAVLVIEPGSTARLHLPNRSRPSVRR